MAFPELSRVSKGDTQRIIVSIADEYAVGNVSGAVTIDFANGFAQAMTLTGSISSFTFNNPLKGTTVILRLIQGGSGSYTVAWGSLKWGDAGAPTLSTAVGKIDIIAMYYDGTYFYASCNGGF